MSIFQPSADRSFNGGRSAFTAQKANETGKAGKDMIVKPGIEPAERL